MATFFLWCQWSKAGTNCVVYGDTPPCSETETGEGILYCGIPHLLTPEQMDEQSQTAQSQMDEQSQTAQSHAKQPLTPTHISSHTSAYSMKATPPKLQNKGENQTISGHASRATFTPPAGHVQEHRYSAQNSGGKAEEVVSRFLSNCVPSMGHLLPAFVNYGCVHEEFLYSMSQWPQPLITNFVRNAMAKAEVEISDMEVDVIVVEILRLFGNF